LPNVSGGEKTEIDSAQTIVEGEDAFERKGGGGLAPNAEGKKRIKGQIQEFFEKKKQQRRRMKKGKERKGKGGRGGGNVVPFLLKRQQSSQP